MKSIRFVRLFPIFVILLSLAACAEVKYQSPEQQAQCQQLLQDEQRETRAFVKKSELNTAYTRMFGRNVLKNASKLVHAEDEDVDKLTRKIHQDAIAECTKKFNKSECGRASKEMRALYKRSQERKIRFKLLECPGDFKST